jgi:hypothetical protein
MSVEDLTKASQAAIQRQDYTGAINHLNAIRRADPNNIYAQGVLPFVQEKLATLPDDVIQRKLDRRIPSAQFSDVGLGDVIEFLRDIAGVTIKVNWKALEAQQITPNTPVKAQLIDISFGNGLTTILEDAGNGRAKLVYAIDNGAILVTTQADLQNGVETRTYEIADVLAGSDNATTRLQRTDELVKTIKDFIDHDTWKDNGGASGTIQASDGKLIITQRSESHRHIAALLETMRKSRVK